MRSRQRLIEVLETVNGNVVGEITAFDFQTAAECLKLPGHCPDCAFDLTKIFKYHLSPHVRELARQAHHYLTGE